MSSRMEEHLKACINKTGTAGLGRPQSRSEELLQELAVTIQEGGGTNAEEVNKIIEEHLTPKSAIPNSGYVDKVYFNTSLTYDEVKSLLDSIECLDGGEYENILVTESDEKAIFIEKFGESVSIFLMFNNNNNILWVNEAGVQDYDLEHSGWQTFTNPIEINSTVTNTTSWGATVGTQNELLTDLVYVQSEKYTTVEKVEEVVESYLFEETSGPGTAVPNTGFVENIYFNTEVSDAKLFEIATSLYAASNHRSIFYLLNRMNVGYSDITLEFNVSNTSVISEIRITAEKELPGLENQTDIGNSRVLIYDSSTGWNTSIQYPFVINQQVMDTAASGRESCGTYNHLLTDVFSITPFRAIKEKYLKEDALYTTNGGTAVPNTGYVEKVYLNTNMSIGEVKALLDKIPSNEAFGNTQTAMVFANSQNTLQFLCGVNQGAYMIADMALENLGFVYIDGTAEVEQFGFSGWNPEFNGVIEVNDNVLSEFEGNSVGTQNELLKDLISSAPFVKQEKYVTSEKVNKIKNEVNEVNEVVENCLFEYETAVPTENGSYVENIYFNTSLSIEEVKEIINHLITPNNYSSNRYVLYYNADANVELTLQVSDTYGWYEIANSSNGELIFESNNGWNNQNVLNVNASNILLDANANYRMVTQDEAELLKKLISITPFDDGQEKYITNKKVNEKIKNSLYVDIEPVSVPITEYVGNIYFNTNLSNSEVQSILSTLDYSVNDNEIVYVIYNDTQNKRIYVSSNKGSSDGLTYSYRDPNTNKTKTLKLWTYSGGWSLGAFANKSYCIEFNAENTDTYYQTGTQNELLKDLISITPFGKQEKYVSKSYLDEYMKNNFENGNEGSY